jgi:hypothetical protein
MTPDERARAIMEHFEDLPPEIRADLERVVASAIRRAVFHELAGIEKVVRPLYMRPAVTEKDKIKADVYDKWLNHVQLRKGNYATNATFDDPGSVLNPGK